MNLTSELVEAYKAIALNPGKYGVLHIRPLPECFQKTSTVTANHLLFEAYSTHEAPNMPKLIFYIIMNDLYGLPNKKDSNGLLGYDLEFIKPTSKNAE